MSDSLVLTRGETKGLGFASAKEVYEPTESGLPAEVAAPEDMVGWFWKHAHLHSSEPQPTAVGGVEGERFDVTLGDLPEDYVGVCGRDCVPTLRFSDGTRLGVYPEDRLRLIVLEDVERETVVTGFAAPSDDFDEYVPEAQKVLAAWSGKAAPNDA